MAAVMSQVVTPDDFRHCLGVFPTGVAIITILGPDDERVGVTVNSFSSVSLEPPLILWSLRRQALSFAMFDQAARFVVNILSEQQAGLALQFARPDTDRFSGLDVTAGLGGTPLLPECAAYLECRMYARYPGGDHQIFIGEVERCEMTGRTPLVFCGSKFLELGAAVRS